MAEKAGEYLKEVKSPTELKRVLEFEVPRERVEDEIHDIIEGIRKDVALPGFRKGKAPLEMVMARYGETARKEAIERLIPEAYEQALKKEALKPALPAEISDLKYGEDGPLAFHIAIELYPKIDLKPYAGVKVAKAAKPVEDGDVEREIGNLRERLAKYEKVEGPLESGQIAVLDYWRIGEDEKPVKGSRVANHPVEIGSGKLVKEFDEGLVGAARGETKAIEVTYPDDVPDAEMRGKTVRFGAEVKETMRKVLPGLDEDFAKMFGAESLDALKAKVREGLAAAYEQEATSQAKQEVLHKVTEENFFEVPEGFVSMALESMLKPYREEFEKEGDAETTEKLAQLTERLKPIAVKLVKEEFIVDEIAKRENIAAEEKDIEAILAALAKRKGISVEEARAEAAKSEETGRWRRDIVRNKVLDFLFRNAEVEG
jgi:trigger factor